MPPTLVFDVNETLLDLQVLNPHFERVFGTVGHRGQWFAQMLRYSFTVTITGQYFNFAELGGAALDALARREGVALSAEDRQAVVMGMRELPAHPDVAAALARFQAAGVPMVTLTNSPPAQVAAQLEFAGIASYFSQQLSVDSVRTFKPARAVYDYAAQTLGVAVGELMLVAAHDWDVAGALAAGMRAAFVARPGMAVFPLGPQPEIVVTDLGQLADYVLN